MPHTSVGTPLHTGRLADLLCLLQQTPVATCVLRGPALEVELASDQFARLTGREPRELLGRPFAELFPLAVGQGLDQRLREALRTSQPWAADEVVAPVVRESGTTWWQLRCSPLRLPDDPGGAAARVIVVVTDVTAQVRPRLAAEAERARTEALTQRLRHALDATALGAWELDQGGNIAGSTRALRLLCGAEGAATLSAVLARIHPEDRARASRVLTSGDDRANVDVRLRDDEGSDRWVRLVARSVGAGPAARIVGTVADVTEARRAESEARLRETIAQNASLALFMMDASRRCTYMNPAAERMTGFALAEAHGRPLHDVLHPTRPDGRPYPTHECPIERAHPGDAPRRGEEVFLRRDGTYYPVAFTASPVIHDGAPVGTVLEVRDLTDEQRGEAERRALVRKQERRAEQLRGLAEAALELQLATSLDEALQGVVLRARSIIGVHLAISILAREPGAPDALHAVSLSDKYAAWRDHDPRPDERGIQALVRRTNRPLRLRADEPGWAQLQPGTERQPPLRGLLAVPLVGRDGASMGLLMLSDKLERELTESDEDMAVQLARMASTAVENALLLDALSRENARAEAANRAKDEFLAMLGHELRNPLSPILTALQLMRLRGGDLMVRERAVIERQVQHLLRLVDDLLDVSRITRGKVQLRRRRIPLHDAIARAVEIASPLLEEKAHRLVTDVDRRLTVDGDEDRLAQVFSNLLTNAAKYTDRGGTIQVRASVEEAEAVLRVRDTGVGIPPDLHPRVFQLFVQGARSVDRAQGGLGLGLAIVKSLVELHGGSVGCASDGPGRGSEFTIRLPLAGLTPPVHEQQGPARVTTPASTVGRLLLVDDNREAVDLLADALRGRGHEVALAYDGPGALEVVRDFEPQVALLDLGLPVMDGYELAARLREAREGVRLVALTGYGQESDRERSRQAGFDEHLVKPVDLETLDILIEAMLAPTARSLAEPS